LFGRIEF